MNFKQTIKKDFDEWKNQGYCQSAIDLNKKIGEDYFDTASPQFFTGDINSKIVFIHLNPKRNRDEWNKECNDVDFTAYWDRHAQFGKNYYGKNSPRTHKSPFDHKQIRFLKPFNILPFNDDVYHNLEVVADKKLQLELVPFGSPDFIYQRVGKENLQPFINLLLDTILESKREYIIFCGKIFSEILGKSIVEQKVHSFHLTKNDGKPTVSLFEVMNIRLKHNNTEIIASIAPQFAKQGYPVGRYGEKVYELYGKF
ncbi:hypothetical protein LJC69_05625 [Bacteroidales bacterium OttesenSCG-928-K22]|nr:hypothetical protein [Bacteroidales bacterium OttesenSCG-928-K22]